MPSSQNGKKQNTGVYYTNGIQYRNVSHKYFKPGTRVIKNKTGEVGIVLKKNVKGPRSLIRVQFDNIEYVYSNFSIDMNTSTMCLLPIDIIHSHVMPDTFISF